MEPGAMVRFTTWYDKRAKSGTYLRTLPNGRLLVRTMHQAARGGSWSATDVPVRPEDVVEVRPSHDERSS